MLWWPFACASSPSRSARSASLEDAIAAKVRGARDLGESPSFAWANETHVLARARPRPPPAPLRQQLGAGGTAAARARGAASPLVAAAARRAGRARGRGARTRFVGALIHVPAALPRRGTAAVSAPPARRDGLGAGQSRSSARARCRCCKARGRPAARAGASSSSAPQHATSAHPPSLPRAAARSALAPAPPAASHSLDRRPGRDALHRARAC